MRKRIGVRRTYTYPPELLKTIEEEAKKRLLQNNDRIGKTQLGSICRTIICIAIRKHLPEIAKMTKEEFQHNTDALDLN